MPGALAYLTFWAELIGGGLILAGVYSRWASAMGWVFTSANGGWEYPAFLAAAAVTQSLLGDGHYALANRLGRRNLMAVPARGAQTWS